MDSDFKTARLGVSEITKISASQDDEGLISCIPLLFTPAVVEHLPPNFHNVNSESEARLWLVLMLSESRLYRVELSEPKGVIGFVFAYEGEEGQTHIGYLLGEMYWGKGLASELLRGFLEYAAEQPDWKKLIGGVARDNLASSKLLLKLGFVEQETDDSSVAFFEYRLP
ncbi:MAG: GNAT family N-acetyltransferase [Granulosicoccaceae bacterium]